MAIPLMCRQARPFVLSPFPFPEDYITSISTLPDRLERTSSEPKHVIHLAWEWREMLRADTALSRAQIAANHGLSRARVTQIMNLLQLPRSILRTLSQVTAPDEIRCYTERKLRQLLLLQTEAEKLNKFAVIQKNNHP
jgi:hypothetical protein